MCEIAFGELGLSENEFYSMTWKAFLLKQNGRNKSVLADRKYQRLLTYKVCQMLKHPKSRFPKLTKFIEFEGDDESAETGMTPEERREIAERNRKFKMK